jgi:hypothetical protein
MARRIAVDKIRKHDKTPELMEMEKSLTEALGTRVVIENRPKGGRVLIEFFSPEDLTHILAALAAQQESKTVMADEPADVTDQELAETTPMLHPNTSSIADAAPPAKTEEELYSVRNFTV